MASTAAEFVGLVFGESFPAHAPYVAVTELDGRNRTHFCLSHLGVSGLIRETTKEAYVRVSYMTVKPKSGRGAAGLSGALPGLWLDIDVAGPTRKPGRKYAPSKPAAIDLANSLLQPTVLVDSGYGIQAWWLFSKPWLLLDDTDRVAATELETAWIAAHRGSSPWELDSVQDLARLMRLPGTLNGKGDEPAEVKVLEVNDRRWVQEDFAKKIGSRPSAPAPIDNVRSLFSDAVDPGSQPPTDKLLALTMNDEVFARILRKRDSDDPSRDDFRLAQISMAAGWTDEEVAALLTYHRQSYNQLEDRQKGLRRDYLERTVAKARLMPTVPTGGDAPSSPAPKEKVTPQGRADTLARFSKIIDLEISDLTRTGYDNSVRWLLTLPEYDDLEVPMTTTQLTEPFRFVRAIAEATDPPRMLQSFKRADWAQMLASVLSIAEVADDPEAVRRSDYRLDLTAYAHAYGCPTHDEPSPERDVTVYNRMPFRQKGVCLLMPQHALAWLTQHRPGKYATEADIHYALRIVKGKKGGRMFKQQFNHSGGKYGGYYWEGPPEMAQ